MFHVCNYVPCLVCSGHLVLRTFTGCLRNCSQKILRLQNKSMIKISFCFVSRCDSDVPTRFAGDNSATAVAPRTMSLHSAACLSNCRRSARASELSVWFNMTLTTIPCLPVGVEQSYVGINSEYGQLKSN